MMQFIRDSGSYRLGPHQHLQEICLGAPGFLDSALPTSYRVRAMSRRVWWGWGYGVEDADWHPASSHTSTTWDHHVTAMPANGGPMY